MNRQSVIALVVGGLLAAFGLVVLFSQTAYAQGFERQSVSSFFPRQSELWSISADPNTYTEVTQSGHNFVCHIFTVQRDGLGRLPVLTTIHAPNSVAYPEGGRLMREINGLWTYLEQADHNGPQFESRFHNAIYGVVLQPGRYAITGFGTDALSGYILLASGYWANR